MLLGRLDSHRLSAFSHPSGFGLAASPPPSAAQPSRISAGPENRLYHDAADSNLMVRRFGCPIRFQTLVGWPGSRANSASHCSQAGWLAAANQTIWLIQTPFGLATSPLKMVKTLTLDSLRA